MSAASWKLDIEKEEKLRLKWFMKHEAKLVAAANKPKIHQVQEKDLEDLKDARHKLYVQTEKFPRIKTEDPPNTDYEGALYNIMKPVLPKVKNILYKSLNEGRVQYLKKRIQILPEDRYYFPETTNFQYGWKMWECAKTMEKTQFGRRPIIRKSFYRRRAGIERDPDWYTTPFQLSPTICNTSSC